MLRLEQIEQALQAPTMEAVIALTERVQTLEQHPDGMVFTLLREIDNTLVLGYSDQLQTCLSDYNQRGFRMVEARRGTKRELRLLLVTLEEIGLQTSYGSNYFDADNLAIRHLSHLGWPIGDLQGSRRRKHPGNRQDRLIEDS